MLINSTYWFSLRYLRMGGLIMEKNIIGEVKIPLSVLEAYSKEKWETGNYILTDYLGNEIQIVKENFSGHFHQIDGYSISVNDGAVIGQRFYVGIDNNIQRPYLKRKKEISPRTLVNSFKYIHFVAGNNSDVHHYYGAYLSNQETLDGSTFSLEIK